MVGIKVGIAKCQPEIGGLCIFKCMHFQGQQFRETKICASEFSASTVDNTQKRKFLNFKSFFKFTTNDQAAPMVQATYKVCRI